MVGDSIMDSCGDCWMSRHAKIVVGTPDSDVLLAPRELPSSRKGFGFSVDLLEDPVRWSIFFF